MTETNEGLSNLLHEERRFAPSEEFAAQANVKADAYDAAAADRLAFWEQQARRLDWETEWSQTAGLVNAPFAKWFVGGKLNAVGQLRRPPRRGRATAIRIAIHFEGEPGDTRTVTYAQLQDLVGQAANALTELGIGQGDRVAIYLPMSLEAVVSMLACARLGAIHSVIFGGFSAQAIYDRVIDADASLIITADGGYRRGKVFPLKPAVDEALAKGTTNVQNVARGQARRERGRLDRGPRRLVVRPGRPAAHRAHSRRPSTPRIRCSSSTPRAPPVSRRASCTPPAAT